MILDQLSPQKVMYFFEAISAIPRPSNYEKLISDYLVQFAEERALEVIQDEKLNVIIKKVATSGYESVPPVIIQGHMDMVPEKNKGTEHNFQKDPIKLRIDGEYIKATHTTLGADNGIAVAMAMALLDSQDIPHPSLEIMITTGEELGMLGAGEIDPSLFKGRSFINLDTEEEGCIYVGCSGGGRLELTLPFEYVKATENTSYLITIRGLKGGHSGIQIHEQLGNANKMIGRILNSLRNKIHFQLHKITGGDIFNAIPREADAIIVASEDQEEVINNEIKHYQEILTNEYQFSDSGLTISVLKQDKVENVLDSEATNKMINFLCIVPNGVDQVSLSIPGLVQTSSNLGVISMNDQSIQFLDLVRSSVMSEYYDMLDRFKILADIFGMEMEIQNQYPAWQYQVKSAMRDLAIKTHEQLFKKTPEIKAVHAGLECGILMEKFNNELDIISIGPNIYNPHTPDESIHIPSIELTWKWLLSILAQMK